MQEIWKDIPGYEGLYMISNLSHVYSFKLNRLLIQYKDENGYKDVWLTKDGKGKHYSVHRLVAMTFIPNPDNLPQVNHKDENPSNNCVLNLEWCTAKYNCNYGNHNKNVSKSLKKLYEDGTLISPMKDKKHSLDARAKMSESAKLRPSNQKGLKRTDEQRKRISESHKGLKHTEEQKRKIGEKAVGNKASTGFKWITNGKEIKYVSPIEFEKYIATGEWQKGRKKWL